MESPTRGRAFLKALDFAHALSSPDPARILQSLTQAYNYERDICLRCNGHNMDRVVRALDHGSIRVDDRPESVAQYLIFELADGDIRMQLDRLTAFDVAWALRSLHHVATGLKQLHSVQIAHQDLKPSNVLVFERDISKLADLGRSSVLGQIAPHDGLSVAGDPAYAPLELIYGHVAEDWPVRRFGCDAYLLGSMVVFLFSRASMTTLVLERMLDIHIPPRWNGTYSEVLPYLRNAFDEAILAFQTGCPTEHRDALTRAIRELCEPDIARRGDPLRRVVGANRFALDRYVTLFDLLARRAELEAASRN